MTRISASKCCMISTPSRAIDPYIYFFYKPSLIALNATRLGLNSRLRINIVTKGQVSWAIGDDFRLQYKNLRKARRQVNWRADSFAFLFSNTCRSRT